MYGKVQPLNIMVLNLRGAYAQGNNPKHAISYKQFAMSDGKSQVTLYSIYFSPS